MTLARVAALTGVNVIAVPTNCARLPVRVAGGDRAVLLIALLIPLGLAIGYFALALWKAASEKKASPSREALGLGAVVNFFDTLGIGSMAPTMAWFKFRNMVADRLIPSTMLVGLTPPTITQGIIFLILLGVMVDPVLLTGCIIALLAGGIVGAPLAKGAHVRLVQLIVAVALLVAGAFYAVNNLHLMPPGGTASGLPFSLTLFAIAANFAFGVLLNFGVGNYAPSLLMFSMMGMDPRLCFPIMAAGAGLAAAAAGIRHINYGEINLKVVTGMAIGGIPAVFVAAFIVKTMPMEVLRWLVMMIVVYAAVMMLRSALTKGADQRSQVPSGGAVD